MLGLVERTEPVVLPNTGTCSRGDSEDNAGERRQVIRKWSFFRGKFFQVNLKCSVEKA